MVNESVFYKILSEKHKRQNSPYKRHNKRQMDFNKRQQNYPAVEKDYKNITIFKDSSFKFLYQKTERLSMAIYLITNLMSVDEPIKWKLRKTTLNLLDNVMTLSNANLSFRDNCLRDISQKLFHLISLFEVAFRAGFISAMNYQIVSSEMKKLTNFLAEYDFEDNRSRTDLFGGNFFNQNIEEVRKGQIQRDVFNRDHYNQSQQKTENIKDIIKDTISDKGQNKRQTRDMSFIKIQTTASNLKDEISKSYQRNERREKILNIIKQKGSVTIKDITDIIKDISEKTIQRELISLVEENVLLKEGERRWSKYMLKP